MASLPVVGSIDWKWLIIGILVDKFLLGFLLSLLHKARGSAAAATS